VNLPPKATMLQGLRTAIYQVSDLAQATEWYTQVLGFGPYFNQPFYVGFNVGGFELGLQSEKPAATAVENVVAYWGVEDVEAEVARLAGLGASIHSEPRDVGEGIIVATVRDPFGNVLGLIRNPHFKV
jgi:predicted enzyme related to lactoylglutathione lyase